MKATRRSRRRAAVDDPGARDRVAPGVPAPGAGAELASGFRDAEALAFVLDRLPVGVLLVDGSGHVVWMNASARTRIAAGDELTLRRGRLTARWHADTDAIQRLIERAIAAGGSGVLPDPEVLSLSRSSAGPSRLVIVGRAVQRLGPPPSRGAAQAVIFLSDAQHQLHASRQRLRGLFDLTPAESELLALLAEGCSVRAAAERLAITHESARTYLKHVLHKTGTRRQAELVRLALSVATAGANEP